MSENASGFATATTEDGFTVTSSSETTEQLTENLKPEPKPEPEGTGEPAKEPDPKLSKAASKLGKAGGEAAAAKRAEAKAAEEAEKAEDAPATETTERPLGKPRDDPRARMLEATRKEAEAKRRAEAAEARAAAAERALAEKEAGKAPADPKTPPAKATAPEKPKAEDFGTYEEFVEALADYRADEKLRNFQQQLVTHARTSAQRTAQEKAISSFQERMGKAFEADPTYIERTAALMNDERFKPTFTLPLDANGRMIGYTQLNVAADEVFRSEQAPALTLYFAEHPEELQRLETLPTVGDVQVEVRAIARSLATAPAPQPAPKAEISRAKPPVRPVAGAPHTSAEPDPDTSSVDEHIAYWNAKGRR